VVLDPAADPEAVGALRTFYGRDFLLQALLDLPSPLASPPPLSGRFLVLDEASLFRRLAVATVERVGFLCYSESDGERALDLVRRDPGVSVVILDGDSPKLAPPSLVGRLRQARPELLLFSQSTSEEPPWARSSGLVAHLVKPWTAEELLEALRLAAH
jgi:CheY-like chemotaxis protein